MKRLSRVAYYMQLANLVAQRSTCYRAKVGAVLVHEGKIVATGYNGSVPHGQHCIDEGCLLYEGHCIRTIHAEMNAILHLERLYADLILYCTHEPCLSCFKALITVNVRSIYYFHKYTCHERELVLADIPVPIRPRLFREPLDLLKENIKDDNEIIDGSPEQIL